MNEDLLGRLRDYEISVLMGGWSSEREISLKSGHAVTESLKTLGLKPRSIDLKSAEHIRDIVDSLDLAFIALHGKGGEDGFVQKILEDSGKKFTGSNSKSCEIAMNKLETKKIWRELSLPTPDFVEIINAGTKDSATIPYVSGEEDVGHLDKSFVVKPAREGSSLGITIVHPGRGSLEEAMKEALNYDDLIIVEAYIEGQEVTVPILGEKTLKPVCIKPKNEFYDFHAKYERDDTEYYQGDFNPEELDMLRDFAWHGFSSLGCTGWGRVDFILDKERNFQLLEVNTSPGMTENSLVPKSARFQDMDFSELIINILKEACFYK
tara:strand:+ start:1730 stop:2695 length:966 start_codon:yes stop_codon:yes gene_type:complete